MACDVTNPLCGTQGATYVFGPQKGVTAEQRELLDRAVSHFASVLEAELHAQACQIPGAGAAGGLGFAFLSCLHAWLRPGIEVVLHALRLEESLRDAAFVLTGEGCLDGQTAMGKTPMGVAALAKCFGVPVIALAGAVKPEARACNACGINAFFPILPAAMPLEQAMEPAGTGFPPHRLRDTEPLYAGKIIVGENCAIISTAICMSKAPKPGGELPQ